MFPYMLLIAARFETYTVCFDGACSSASPKQAYSFHFMLFKCRGFPADNESVFSRKCKQILCVLLSQLSFHRKLLAGGKNQTKTKPYLYVLKKYTHYLKSIRSHLIFKPF